MKFEILPSIWREEIGKRIDSSIWREEIGNRNRLVNSAGRNRPSTMMRNLSVVTPAIASILLLLNYNPTIGFRLPSSTSTSIISACTTDRQQQCQPHHVLHQLHEHGFGVGDTDAVDGKLTMMLRWTLLHSQVDSCSVDGGCGYGDGGKSQSK